MKFYFTKIIPAPAAHIKPQFTSTLQTAFVILKSKIVISGNVPSRQSLKQTFLSLDANQLESGKKNETCEHMPETIRTKNI